MPNGKKHSNAQMRMFADAGHGQLDAHKIIQTLAQRAKDVLNERGHVRMMFTHKLSDVLKDKHVMQYMGNLLGVNDDYAQASLAKLSDHKNADIRRGFRAVASLVLGDYLDRHPDIAHSFRRKGIPVILGNIRDEHDLVESLESIPEEVGRSGIWYLENLLPSSQKKFKDAARVMLQRWGADPDRADALANEMFLDEHHARFLNKVRRHHEMTNDENNRLAHAAALYIARHKPLYALFNGLIGATSINASVYDNVLQALAAMTHALAHDGQGNITLDRAMYGSHAGAVRGLAAAKLVALTALSEIALSNKKISKDSPIYDAVKVLRDTVRRMKNGASVGDEKIDGIESPTPGQVAAYFLVANHKRNDVNTVASRLNVLGNMLNDIYNIKASLLDFLPRLSRFAKDRNIDEIRREIDGRLSAAVHHGGIGAFAEEAERLLQEHRVVSNNRYEGKAIKIMMGKVAEPLERLKRGMGHYAERFGKKEDLMSKMHFAHLGDSVPGYLFLGPKIGSYAANLIGDDRLLTYDTWMRFINPLKVSVVPGKKKQHIPDVTWSDTDKHIKETKERYNHIIQNINNNPELRQRVIKSMSRVISNVASQLTGELGIDEDEALKLTHRIYTSPPSIQAIQWVLARGQHGKVSHKEEQRNLHNSAEHIAKNEQRLDQSGNWLVAHGYKGFKPYNNVDIVIQSIFGGTSKQPKQPDIRQEGLVQPKQGVQTDMSQTMTSNGEGKSGR